MRVLLIEDDTALGAAIRDQIAADGHSVDWVQRLDRAGDALAAAAFDLVLLDLMLPDGLGIPFLRALRARGDVTPVIILTALDQVSDRIAGLNAGADDYMVKPFAFTELLARMEALLRRSGAGGSPSEALQLVVADLQLDLAKRRATRGGQRLDLSAKEFQLLSLLMRRAGEVLSRTEIAEQVWDVNFDHGTNVIDVAVRRLRAKMDTPFPAPLLHTVRGMGYVLESRPE